MRLFTFLILVLLTSGCATTIESSATIEYAPNRFYLENHYAFSYALNDEKLISRLESQMQELCESFTLKRKEDLRLTQAITPPVRCYTYACGDHAAQTADAICDSKKPFSAESAYQLKKYDLSDERQKAEFYEYAVGSFWSERDHTAIETFRQFGYPNVAYIDGYRKAFWFYKRPSGEVVIEFTGGPVPPMGYKYNEQRILLLTGGRLDQIEFHPEVVPRY